MAGWHGVLKEHERAELIRSSCVSSIPLLGPASQFLLTLDAMFDPELAILLLDLDESVHCWLRAEGVEHCCDIHFGWSSEDDFSGSFQRFVADRQLEFDISQLDRLWRAAGRAARTEAASTASAVSAARLSVHLPVTAKGNVASSEVQPKRRKVMVPWRSVPTAVAPAVSLSSSALGPARLDEKAQKVVALFQICASLFLDLQEVGFASLQWEDSAAVEAAARVVMKAAFRLSVQRLGMLASTMRRWMRWACEHSAPAGCPAAADLAAFLQHVSLGGPTAASSVFQVFLWTNQNLGPSGHCSILWHIHAQGHATQKAVELQPWEFVNLIRLAASLTGTPQLLLSFIIQSACSCIRFAHFQRSRLVADHKSWLEFECSEGKSRTQGVRPPYRWATPEIRVGGFSLLALLRRFFGEILLPAGEAHFRGRPWNCKLLICGR